MRLAGQVALVTGAQQASDAPSRRRSTRTGQIPLEGRMARLEEIAKVAVFLASEEAGWVTDQTIHVNGGAFRGG